MLLEVVQDEVHLLVALLADVEVGVAVESDLPSVAVDLSTASLHLSDAVQVGEREQDLSDGPVAARICKELLVLGLAHRRQKLGKKKL